MKERIRLTVVVSEFGAAANVGGDVERTARTFDLSDEIADYIRSNRGQWSAVSLALEVTAPAVKNDGR